MPHRLAMPRALLLALLAAVPVHAQTCGGAIRFELGRERDGHVEAASAGAFTVTAATVGPDGGHSTAYRWRLDGLPPLDAFVARPELFLKPTQGRAPWRGPVQVDRDTLRDRSLFEPRDEIVTRTRCGLALLRYVVTDLRDETRMTLDLYNVPPHVPVRAEAPLVVRPGRWTFDFADGTALSSDALRRAP